MSNLYYHFDYKIEDNYNFHPKEWMVVHILYNQLKKYIVGNLELMYYYTTHIGLIQNFQIDHLDNCKYYHFEWK